MTTPLSTTSQSTPSQRTLLIVAWTVMLLASALPNILWQEVGQVRPGLTILWLKLGLLAVLAAAGYAWQPLGRMRPFILLLVLVFAAEELLIHRLGNSAQWQAWFGGSDVSFTTEMMSVQLRRVAVAVAVIAGLRLYGYRRREMFLTPGRLDAPVTPVPIAGFPTPSTWMRFGLQWALYISLGTLLFLVIGARPAPALLLQALPMLPLILLFAVMNAFSEEMTYRAAFLTTLVGPVGPRHAIWLSAIFFGLGHYYGVPYGVIGVIMASFLGWLLGKAMLETRGFFWAWFIHFLQDVIIFTFMAVGSVTPGGG